LMDDHKERKRRRGNVERGQIGESQSLNRLKSALRQTRRFLAKEDIPPRLRIENERRLEALNQQLNELERNTHERRNAVRYHMVKFVERKKILRKINQVKTQLVDVTTSDRKSLEKQLLQLRCDLHYILNFPNDRKYVSLLVDGEYVPHKVKSVTQEASTSANTADTERSNIRKIMKKAMKIGELTAEPELELDSRNRSNEDRPRKRKLDELKRKERVEISKGTSSSKAKSKFDRRQVVDDDFFETEGG